MVNAALIQTIDGHPINVPVANAFYGLRDMGLDIQFFEFDQLLKEDPSIVLAADKLVVGGIATVKMALRRLGVPVPPNLDYPEELQRFLGRKVWAGRLSDMNGVDEPGWKPRFVKPMDDQKAFTGRLITAFRDLIPIAGFIKQKPDMPVWFSEPIKIRSEWRYFCHGGRVLTCHWYAGYWWRTPNFEVVQEAADAFKSAPVSYCLDFAVVETESGVYKSVLIEVNDGFAFGPYGLRPEWHAGMLMDRWEQMMGEDVHRSFPRQKPDQWNPDHG